LSELLGAIQALSQFGFDNSGDRRSFTAGRLGRRGKGASNAARKITRIIEDDRSMHRGAG
jgi:hypothetical protein